MSAADIEGLPSYPTEEGSGRGITLLASPMSCTLPFVAFPVCFFCGLWIGVWFWLLSELLWTWGLLLFFLNIVLRQKPNWLLLHTQKPVVFFPQKKRWWHCDLLHCSLFRDFFFHGLWNAPKIERGSFSSPKTAVEVHQLRLVVYPIIYKVLYIPGG